MDGLVILFIAFFHLLAVPCVGSKDADNNSDEIMRLIRHLLNDVSKLTDQVQKQESRLVKRIEEQDVRATERVNRLETKITEKLQELASEVSDRITTHEIKFSDQIELLRLQLSEKVDGLDNNMTGQLKQDKMILMKKIHGVATEITHRIQVQDRSTSEKIIGLKTEVSEVVGCMTKEIKRLGKNTTTRIHLQDEKLRAVQNHIVGYEKELAGDMKNLTMKMDAVYSVLTGVLPGQTNQTAAESCEWLKEHYYNLNNGRYWISSKGKPEHVYCDMKSTYPCGDILHRDAIQRDVRTGAIPPAGWIMCYIDYSDTTYHDTKCENLLLNIAGGRYKSSSEILSAGGNFGCYHGKSGSHRGPSYATNDVVVNACRNNVQHTTKLNAWDTKTTTLGVCIRLP